MGECHAVYVNDELKPCDADGLVLLHEQVYHEVRATGELIHCVVDGLWEAHASQDDSGAADRTAIQGQQSTEAKVQFISHPPIKILTNSHYCPFGNIDINTK